MGPDAVPEGLPEKNRRGITPQQRQIDLSVARLFNASNKQHTGFDRYNDSPQVDKKKQKVEKLIDYIVSSFEEKQINKIDSAIKALVLFDQTISDNDNKFHRTIRQYLDLRLFDKAKSYSEEPIGKLFKAISIILDANRQGAFLKDEVKKYGPLRSLVNSYAFIGKQNIDSTQYVLDALTHIVELDPLFAEKISSWCDKEAKYFFQKVKNPDYREKGIDLLIDLKIKCLTKIGRLNREGIDSLIEELSIKPDDRNAVQWGAYYGSILRKLEIKSSGYETYIFEKLLEATKNSKDLAIIKFCYALSTYSSSEEDTNKNCTGFLYRQIQSTDDPVAINAYILGTLVLNSLSSLLVSNKDFEQKLFVMLNDSEKYKDSLREILINLIDDYLYENPVGEEKKTLLKTIILIQSFLKESEIELQLKKLIKNDLSFSIEALFCSLTESDVVFDQHATSYFLEKVSLILKLSPKVLSDLEKALIIEQFNPIFKSNADVFLQTAIDYQIAYSNYLELIKKYDILPKEANE
jgi:hypothetical protein